jgi:hypothetical protein
MQQDFALQADDGHVLDIGAGRFDPVNNVIEPQKIFGDERVAGRISGAPAEDFGPPDDFVKDAAVYDPQGDKGESEGGRDEEEDDIQGDLDPDLLKGCEDTFFYHPSSK